MTEEEIRHALKFVKDPEVGVNIVDLGLLYSIEIDGGTVSIQMTMTSPTCPLHAVIVRAVEGTLRAKFHQVREVNVDLVWEPAWNPSMMSPKARQVLG